MRIKTISLTKAAILVCATIGTVILLDIPQSEAFSFNFVYNDLLAHPQYDVQFLTEVVPASSVASRPNAHRRQVKVPIDGLHFAKDTLRSNLTTLYVDPFTGDSKGRGKRRLT